jgi:hypothetical protein
VLLTRKVEVPDLKMVVDQLKILGVEPTMVVHDELN